MKIKFSKESAAVLAVFAASCGLCCWVFSGADVCETGIPDEMTAVSESGGKAVIVIDPGHGGMDGGASSPGGIQEKNINLAIALELKKEAESFGAEVIMTRENDTGLYVDDGRTIRQKKREDLLNRKKIIEESGCTLAISIHLNSFPQNASVYGAQVFYPKYTAERTDVRESEQTSRDFAESVQKSLEINIDDGRQREAMPKNDILLFENIDARIILVECGFLSNATECQKLQTPEYQQELSKAVWEGVNEILCLKKNEKIQVIDSTNKVL